MTSPNWRKIADGLAERLMYNSPCPSDDHLDPDPDCPFCADALAYRAYLDAGGTVRRTSFNETVHVRIPIGDVGR